MNNLKKKSIEELYNYVDQMGLKTLDDNDKNLIIAMLTGPSMKIFDKDSQNAFLLSNSTSQNIKIGIYTQNYLILKQLTQINESNKNITEQNKQIIEQNNKIIELLTMISEK